MPATKVTRETTKSEAVRKQSSALVQERGAAAAQADEGVSAMLPVIAKGKGATVTDIDGNEYIDFDGGSGALLLGHADERIVAAITKAAAKGHGFSGASEPMVRLAELIISRFPSMETLRLTVAPTEAQAAAVRLARSTTGRRAVVVCERRSHDRSADVRGAQADAPERFLPVPYNDFTAAQRTFDEAEGGVAAMMVEPVATSIGLVPPLDGYLARIRALCDACGAALIFDETRTGLRLGPGGAAKLFGVVPDMTCLGGSLSGGLSLAAVGGRKDMILNHAAGIGAPDGQPAGTELAVAAALASIQATGEPGVYEQLDETAALLEKGLSEVMSGGSVATFQTRVCSLLGLFFSESPVTNGVSALKTDTARYARFHRAMLDRGVLIPASSHRPWSVSTAHGKEHIERAVEAAAGALAKSV